MPFGQIVIGPAGAGKSTYCTGMQQLLRLLGRTCHVINLDPGNRKTLLPDGESSPRYVPAVDVSQVCSQWDIMESLSIGPNAALVEAMRLLARSPLSSWMLSKIQSLIPQLEHSDKTESSNRIDCDVSSAPYFLFDCPGQAELITHEPFIQEIISTLSSKLDFRLVAICLVDSSTTNLSNDRLVSAKLLSLSAMACIELPFVNVFAKYDLLPYNQRNNDIFSSQFEEEEDEDPFPYPSDDTTLFLETNSVPISSAKKASIPIFNTTKHTPVIDNQERLWSLLEELVEDISYVQYIPLAIENKGSMLRVLRAADRANGFVFGGLCSANDSIMATATRMI